MNNLTKLLWESTINRYIIRNNKKPVKMLKKTAIKFARNIKLPSGIKVNNLPIRVFKGYPGGCWIPSE